MRRLFNMFLIIVLFGCLLSRHHTAIIFEPNFTVQISGMDMDNSSITTLPSYKTDDFQLTRLIYGFQNSDPLLPVNIQIQTICSVNLLIFWRTFANEYKLLSKKYVAFIPKPHCLRIVLEGLTQTSFHYAKEYFIYTLRRLLI